MNEEEKIDSVQDSDNTESPEKLNIEPSIGQAEMAQPEIPTLENKNMEVHHLIIHHKIT